MTGRMIALSNGHKVWTKTVPGGQGRPLLVVHGGPGAGHDYLEPLEALSADRPVIFWDQLGCGRSDRPDEPTLWTIGRFADEVDEVRRALELARCHLFGHSAGGWFAIEYLVRRPDGVAAVVLASTAASIPQFSAECARLISELPEPMQHALAGHGAAADYAHPDYLAAQNEFYARHLFRLADMPDCLKRTAANIEGNQVYATMNGPNEFTLLGNLRDWDRTAELARIAMPVLVTCGRHDEMGPVCAATLAAGLQDARVAIFEHSSHLAHLEEPEAYMSDVREFLRASDA